MICCITAFLGIQRKLLTYGFIFPYGWSRDNWLPGMCINCSILLELADSWTVLDGTFYSCSHLFLYSNKNLVSTSTNLQLFHCNAWAEPNCPANAEYGCWMVKLDIVAGPRCWLRCWASFSFRKRKFVASRSSGYGSVACRQSAENFAWGFRPTC
jgi:hypothetical protein